MYIDKFKEVIKNDLFNISGRIKLIDKGYFIVRNHSTEQFEVHHKGQIGDTFCLSIPYTELDERTLKRVRETRIEYIQNVIAEMERNNEKIENDNNKKLKEATKDIAKEVYRYTKRHEDKETIDENSNYLKGVV